MQDMGSVCGGRASSWRTRRSATSSTCVPAGRTVHAGRQATDRPLAGQPPAEYTAAVELEAGKLYDLELEYFNHAAGRPCRIALERPCHPGGDCAVIPSLLDDGDVMKAAERTYIRLHKASLLVNGFKLHAA